MLCLWVPWVGNSDRAQWGWHVSVLWCLGFHWKHMKAGMTQQLDAWMIWKFLHSEVSLEPDRLEHWAQLGLLARVPTHGLSVWLGLPHRHGWSRSAFHDLSLEIAKHRFHHSLLVKASTRLPRFKTRGCRSHLLMGGWSGHSAEEHVEWQRLWPSLESTTRPNRR